MGDSSLECGFFNQIKVKKFLKACKANPTDCCEDASENYQLDRAQALGCAEKEDERRFIDACFPAADAPMKEHSLASNLSGVSTVCAGTCASAMCREQKEFK